MDAVNYVRHLFKKLFGLERGDMKFWDKQCKSAAHFVVGRCTEAEILALQAKTQPEWMTDELLRRSWEEWLRAPPKEILGTDSARQHKTLDCHAINQMRNKYNTVHKDRLYQRAVVAAGKEDLPYSERSMLWRRLGCEEFALLSREGSEFAALRKLCLESNGRRKCGGHFFFIFLFKLL